MTTTSNQKTTTAKQTPRAKTTASSATTPHLETDLKRLRLPTFLAEYSSLSAECSREDAKYEDYLARLAAAELAERDGKSISRRITSAKLPSLKELADFDFKSVPSLNKSRVLELSRCGYIGDHTNLVMVGPPGVGKTHLAIALCLSACRSGYRTKFFTASSIVNTYREARDERLVTRLESSLSKLDMIVIDELGYLPIDRSGAESLFGFFSLCYEQVSVIVTTNLPFAQWPQTFAGDERMTGALLDRLTHRIEILAIEGDSYRLKQSRKSSR
jgi:DNA replication protein DnaC